VNCTANNELCRDNGTYYSKQSNPDFPFNLFGNTRYGGTVTCDNSTEVTGYAVGEYI